MEKELENIYKHSISSGDEEREDSKDQHLPLILAPTFPKSPESLSTKIPLPNIENTSKLETDNENTAPPGEDEETIIKSTAGDTDFSNMKEETKKLKKNKKGRMVMNILNTKYEIVRYVAKKMFDFRLTKEDDDDWDIYWLDGGCESELLSKMRPYQKVNHFPGMYALSRKNHLGRHLMRFRRKFPKNYKFFPPTWLLPSEFNEFRSLNNTKRKQTFIVKPEASSQGRGIFLTKNMEDLETGEHFVVQQYLGRPFLIDGLKFDLRIYVLLCGCDPLRIMIFNEGLARFGTEPYVNPTQANLGNLYMHLTNYAINKNSSNFVFNQKSDKAYEGHKRCLAAIWDYIEKEFGEEKLQKLKDQIDDAIIKTICTVQPSLAHIYRSCQPDDIDNSCCFELLGFDILLDYKLKPYLLEVNHSPSFSTDTPFDRKVKKNLIADSITLLHMNPKNKVRYLIRRKQLLQKRQMGQHTAKMSLEEKEKYRDKKMRDRHNYESKHMGGFKLIYPTKDSEKYDVYLEEAANLWENFTGGKKRKTIPMKDKEVDRKPVWNGPAWSSSIRSTNTNTPGSKTIQQRVNSTPKISGTASTSSLSTIKKTSEDLLKENSGSSIQAARTVYGNWNGKQLIQPIPLKFSQGTERELVGTNKPEGEIIVDEINIHSHPPQSTENDVKFSNTMLKKELRGEKYNAYNEEVMPFYGESGRKNIKYRPGSAKETKKVNIGSLGPTSSSYAEYISDRDPNIYKGPPLFLDSDTGGLPPTLHISSYSNSSIHLPSRPNPHSQTCKYYQMNNKNQGHGYNFPILSQIHLQSKIGGKKGAKEVNEGPPIEGNSQSARSSNVLNIYMDAVRETDPQSFTFRIKSEADKQIIQNRPKSRDENNICENKRKLSGASKVVQVPVADILHSPRVTSYGVKTKSMCANVNAQEGKLITCEESLCNRGSNSQTIGQQKRGYTVNQLQNDLLLDGSTPLKHTQGGLPPHNPSSVGGIQEIIPHGHKLSNPQLSPNPQLPDHRATISERALRENSQQNIKEGSTYPPGMQGTVDCNGRYLPTLHTHSNIKPSRPITERIPNYIMRGTEPTIKIDPHMSPNILNNMAPTLTTNLSHFKAYHSNKSRVYAQRDSPSGLPPQTQRIPQYMSGHENNSLAHNAADLVLNKAERNKSAKHFMKSSNSTTAVSRNCSATGNFVRPKLLEFNPNMGLSITPLTTKFQFK